MNDIEQDPPDTDDVRLTNEDNPTNRNYVQVSRKQILSSVLCVLTIISLLLIAIIIILLKTYKQSPSVTYNTTTIES